MPYGHAEGCICPFCRDHSKLQPAVTSVEQRLDLLIAAQMRTNELIVQLLDISIEARAVMVRVIELQQQVVDACSFGQVDITVHGAPAAAAELPEPPPPADQEPAPAVLQEPTRAKKKAR